MGKWLLNEALEELGEVIVDDMRSKVAVDTGALRDSIKYEVKDNILNIYMLDYGDAVDEGTRAHMPPVSAIQGWCNRKGLNAWAVATNIQKYGTRAQPFMDELDDFEENYFSMLSDATFDELEEYVWDKLSKI